MITVRLRAIPLIIIILISLMSLPPIYTLCPYTTLFRSLVSIIWGVILITPLFRIDTALLPDGFWWMRPSLIIRDRKRTRLNSSNDSISYAVFCFIKKKHHLIHITLINKNLIIKK